MILYVQYKLEYESDIILKIHINIYVILQDNSLKKK